MKKTRSFLLSFGVFILLGTFIWGQDPGYTDTLATNAFSDLNEETLEENKNKPPYIGLIGRHEGDKIRLRWGPSRVDVWLRSLKYGYDIYRIEGKDFEDLDNAELIFIDSIFPYPKDKWIQEAEFDRKDDAYFNIALQCIHGAWQSKNLGDNFESLLDKSDELTNRFGLNLMAADFDFNAAVYSGLGYIDNNIDPNKIYLYYVYARNPDTLGTFVENGFIMIDPEYQKEFPDIIPQVVEGENSVSIYWSRDIYDEFYSAYWIERSLDGTNFNRLNEHPYVNPLSDDKETYSPNHAYIDSVTNYIPYIYRINGINAFGQTINSAHTFTGQGVDLTPPPIPRILEGTYINDNVIEIKWSINECPDLSGFKILKGYDFDLPMGDLGVRLSLSDSTFTDENANNLIFHYYVVEAIDTAGNMSQSAPYLVSFNDTIPPPAPSGLNGYCDSLGMVTISWNRNPNLDNMGYKVMFANDIEHEFSLITGEAIRDTFFNHKIALNTLTENIYYRIYAVDLRYNTSKHSEILTVARYDTIPPLKPLFYDYKVFHDSVIMYWYPSNSNDAVIQELMRSTDQLEWNVLSKMDNSLREYTDYDILERVTYFYKIVTYDKSNLTSESPYPLIITPLTRFVIDTPIEISVTEQNGQARIEWKSEVQNAKITIYKSFGENTLQKYKTLDIQDSFFNDNKVYKGSNYKYSVIINFENGKTSNFSEIIPFELASED